MRDWRQATENPRPNADVWYAAAQTHDTVTLHTLLPDGTEDREGTWTIRVDFNPEDPK